MVTPRALEIWGTITGCLLLPCRGDTSATCLFLSLETPSEYRTVQCGDVKGNARLRSKFIGSLQSICPGDGVPGEPIAIHRNLSLSGTIQLNCI
jgi:hypothetical protein